MKYLIALSLFLTGCVSLPFKVTGWNEPQQITFENGTKANVYGNPLVTCYTKYGDLLANGFFVTIRENYLIIDEFGVDYAWIENNDLGNYCILNQDR
jgi:hypothetical protein